jgi:hypothetical protein
MFSVMPDRMANTLGRWLGEDDTAKDFAGKLLTRQIPPNIASLMLPQIMLGAALRGGLRDLQRRVQTRLKA